MRNVTPIRPGRLLLNHLSRVVELAADRHRDPRDERLVRSAKVVSWLCRKAQPFLLPPDGDFGLTGRRSFKIGEARLPYPVIALEFPGDELKQNKIGTLVLFLFDRSPYDQSCTTGEIGVISAAHGPGKVCCNGWAWNDQFMSYEETVTVSVSDAGGVAWTGGNVFTHDICPGALGAPNVYSADYNIRVAADFLCLLSCANVKVTDAPVSRSKMQLEKSRCHNKNRRFLVYKVLELPNSSGDQGAATGTHASPRFHYRRGHIRRLASGRNTWVRMCAVGKAANGIVLKDYDASGLGAQMNSGE